MENREYYTPEISDLFIGYECQRRVTKPNYVEKYLYEWRDYTIDEHYFSVGYEEGQDWSYDEVELRTPCLCKQDIIDLGFKEDFDFTSTKHLQFVKGSIWIPGSLLLDVWYYKQPFMICLKIVENKTNVDGYDITTLFAGVCKSKNELKKLMKDYLNIPI
jgi:hypothetical protein